MYIFRSGQKSLFAVSVFLFFVQFCEAAERPLAEDSLGVTCSLDTDCLNESVCLDDVCYVPKNRYISFRPENSGQAVAFQIVSSACPEVVRWVGEPEEVILTGEFHYRAVESPVFRVWTESLLHVGDDEIGPGAKYEVRATSDGVVFTDPLVLGTVRVWGDVVGRFANSAWQPPNGFVDWDDLAAAIQAWTFNHSPPHRSWVDVDADTIVNAQDVFLVALLLAGDMFATPHIACPGVEAVDCDDGLFCTGIESSQDDGICLAGINPCPNRICNEVLDRCDGCLVDGDCDDSLFCNGIESCANGECRPGHEPCDGLPCTEATDVCGQSGNPLLELVPVTASGGNPVIVGNEITLDEGGHTVTLDIRVSSWGSEMLFAVNATIDPGGYLGEMAVPPNPDVDLLPLGFPDAAERGAYTIVNRCDLTGVPCSCPGDECLPVDCSPLGESCRRNPDLPEAFNFASSDLVNTAALSYLFWIGGQFGNGAEDVGDAVHVGRLILNVPAEAEGVYTVALKPDPERTYLRLLNSDAWPTDLVVSPVRIVLPADCNDNGVEDALEIGTGSAPDCNGNRLIDSCDITRGLAVDCNGNEVPDDCDLSAGSSSDCNSNGVPDECEDCNNNGLADECDIAANAALDADSNGLLDRCEIPKNRYLIFAPDNSTGSVAYRVDLTFSEYFPDAVGTVGWVGEPGGRYLSQVVDTPFFSDTWPSSVSLGDCEIVPVATYELSATPDEVSFGPPIVLNTIARPGLKKWGDVVGSFDGTKWSPPQGTVNIDDAVAAIKKFQGEPTAAPMIWIDVVGEAPNFVANFEDVLFLIKAFQGDDYPFSDPSLCP